MTSEMLTGFLILSVFSIVETCDLCKIPVCETICTDQIYNVQLLTLIGYPICRDARREQITPNFSARKPERIAWVNATADTHYTLIMVDADMPDDKYKGARRYFRHWVIADILGSDLRWGDIHKGSTLTEYKGGHPDPGTGQHRFQFFLLEQPSKLKVAIKTKDRASWNMKRFLKDNGMCGSALRAAYEYKMGIPARDYNPPVYPTYDEL